MIARSRLSSLKNNNSNDKIVNSYIVIIYIERERHNYIKYTNYSGDYPFFKPSASCAVRTPSAWPHAAMITGIPWNLRRAARTAMGPWGKKTPLESEDLKKSDGFQVEQLEMVFFRLLLVLSFVVS